MEKCSAETVYKPESLYPGVTKGDNVDEIATGLQKKASKASVLAQLREIKAGKDQLASEKSPRNGANRNNDPADTVSRDR